MFRIRILHVSDVHFRSAADPLPASRIEQVRREAWKRHRVLEAGFPDEIRRILDTGPIDLICFTGDAADWGLPAEFEEATRFLERLTSDAGVGRERLFVVPGNHDIDRATNAPAWGQLRELAASLGEGSLSEWLVGGRRPLGVETKLLEDTLARRHAYHGWLHQLERNELLPENSAHARVGYRVTLTLPDRPFLLHVVGLDSSWLAGDDNDEGKLMLTQDQIGRHATDERGAPLTGFRLVLVHHPLAHLSDSSAARRLLADYVDLVLRGHQHESQIDLWRDPDRGLVELAAGCLYEGAGGDRYPNGFGVVDIFTDERGRPHRLELLLRSWSKRGHWHDDGGLYRQAPNGRLTISMGAPALAQFHPSLAEPLRVALREQAAACHRGRVPLQTFHKFLVLVHAAPRYFAAVFDSIGPRVAERIETWLRRQAGNHALNAPKTDIPPPEPDQDPTVIAARDLARAELSSQVDARHLLLALLGDDGANTVKHLRKTLDNLQPDGFAEVRRAAERIRPGSLRSPSDLSSLDLSREE